MKFGDLKIYDKNFEPLMIIPKYLSVNWEIKFCEFGLGEIELEKTEELTSLLAKNKYLFIFQDDIQSVVTGYKIAETVVIYTRTLEWLLTKFIVPDFVAQKIKGTSEDTIWSASKLSCYIVKTYLPESVSVEVIEPDSDESNMNDFILEDATDIHSVIKLIMSDKKHGFRFYRDLKNKKFVFISVLARENNNFIFCDDYKTSYESEYIFDIQEEATGGAYYENAKYMGSYDAESNSPFLSVDPENYGKYYIVSDSGKRMGLNLKQGDIILCKDREGNFTILDKEVNKFLVTLPPSDDGIFSWSKLLSVNNLESAEKELEDMKLLDMLTCKTKLSYPEDFNLGDKIKVKLLSGDVSLQKEKLISEIHLWDEVGDTGAMPTTIDISQGGRK